MEEDDLLTLIVCLWFVALLAIFLCLIFSYGVIAALNMILIFVLGVVCGLAFAISLNWLIG